MKEVMALWRKEVKSFFVSPFVYLLSAPFIFLIGWMFFNLLINSKESGSAATLTDSVVRPIFGNINFLLLVIAPLITMKCFAEESKQGTLDLLFLSKLDEKKLIAGKFLSSFTIGLFLLAMTLILPAILLCSHYEEGRLFFSLYLGAILNLACYIIVGVFASSLVQGQILAALIGFAILFSFLLLSWSAYSSSNVMLGQIFAYISIPFHYESFAVGLIRSFDFIYFASFFSVFFLLTRLSLQAKRW